MSLPLAYNLYKLPTLIPAGRRVTSPASVSGTGELTGSGGGGSCFAQAVLFQFGLIWFTVWTEEPDIVR